MSFVDLLKELDDVFNVKIAAYCLMSSYYHILVQTPDANLSRSMRHLNGVYTQRYKETELYVTMRGYFNEPRNVAVYLIRHLRNDTLKQVGEQFGIEKYSTVSSIVERVKYEMKADKVLKKRIQDLADKISKSQRQT